MSVFLSKKGRLLGPGRLQGRLYMVDFFPGLVVDPAQTGWVKGEIYHLEHPETVLQVLDGYEGFHPEAPEKSLFVRQTLTVEGPDQALNCWVYLYQKTVAGLTPIDSGDFLQYERDYLRGGSSSSEGVWDASSPEVD